MRRGDTLGLLLFTLTLQPVMQRVDAACEDDATVLSYLGDVSAVVKLTPPSGAYRRLCVDDDGVRSIRIEPRLPNKQGADHYRGCQATERPPAL